MDEQYQTNVLGIRLLGDGRDYRTLVPAISQMVPVVRPTHYGEKMGPSVEHTV